MPLIVQKFGGTSVGSIERIHQVAKLVINAKNAGQQVVVVVSAMSGETNRLMSLASEIDSLPCARELDTLLSTGEQVSMALLSMALNKQGYSAKSLTGAQAGLYTDNQHNDASIKKIDTQVIESLLADDHIVIVAGFQGVTENGDITTLGRGGSDTTAVALAGALKADECQIFTDVDGIYTCDPRVVADAKKLEVIDFPTMEEMARLGAKVLHLPSVQTAWANGVPLRVLSSFSKGTGSLVKGEEAFEGISGIAIQRNMQRFIIDSSNVNLVLKQCQMLGIFALSGTYSDNQTAIVVKMEDVAKLTLVFSDKILLNQAISLIAMIGSTASNQLSNALALLAEHSITAEESYLDNTSLTFALSRDDVDKAANILHDSFVFSGKALNVSQKHAHIG